MQVGFPDATYEGNSYDVTYTINFNPSESEVWALVSGITHTNIHACVRVSREFIGGPQFRKPAIFIQFLLTGVCFFIYLFWCLQDVGFCTPFVDNGALSTHTPEQSANWTDIEVMATSTQSTFTHKVVLSEGFYSVIAHILFYTEGGDGGQVNVGRI